MTILGIETSTSVCSAAIIKDGEPLKEFLCREESNHARLLPRYVQDLLLFAKENALTIEAVALSEGPGSYTGLRIGTATAKGLCYGLDIPLIPVPTLQLIAAAARQQLPITNDQSAILVPMIDARRMEVYTACYDSQLQPLTEVQAVIVENECSLTAERSNSDNGLTGEAGQEVYYCGDGASKCQAVLTNPNWHFLPDIVPQARYMGKLAEQIAHRQLSNSQSSNGQSVDLAYYEPFYLKDFVAAQSHVKGLK